MAIAEKKVVGENA